VERRGAQDTGHRESSTARPAPRREHGFCFTRARQAWLCVTLASTTTGPPWGYYLFVGGTHVVPLVARHQPPPHHHHHPPATDMGWPRRAAGLLSVCAPLPVHRWWRGAGHRTQGTCTYKQRQLALSLFLFSTFSYVH
jgi:hypothetical protein